MSFDKIYANKTGFKPFNSVCVVTGGSRGIGMALMKELKRRKAKKIINIDMLEFYESGVDFYKCDVGSNERIKAVFKDIIRKYKKIDLICCNAGIAKDDDGLASEDHWNNVLKTNLIQHVNIVRNTISNMVLKKKGWYLITASAAGLLSQVGSATYSTTKHATVGFAEWLSITYGDLGVGVSLLCPQGVNTAMTENIKDGGVAGINGMLEPDLVAEITLDEMFMGKFLITPHNIVKKYIKIKANDTDKWILGMRKLYKKFVK